jgi:hypothetical protein
VSSSRNNEGLEADPSGKGKLPSNFLKFTKALLAAFLSCNIESVVFAKLCKPYVVDGADDPELLLEIASSALFMSALTLAPVELSIT